MHREELVRYGVRLLEDGLAVGTAGNLSVRAGDTVLITPSGVDYRELTPAGICVVSLAASTGPSPDPPGPAPTPAGPSPDPAGPAPAPAGPSPDPAGPAPAPAPAWPGLPAVPASAPAGVSSELPLHLAVYAATGATAVVHTHSPEVVALSTVRDELPAVHYAIAGLGGPVRVARYERFGSGQLATAAVAALDGRHAVILRNHGAVTCGASLAQAYDRALLLEWLARVYRMACSLGEPRILTAAELGEVAAEMRRRRYGEAPDGATAGEPPGRDP